MAEATKDKALDLLAHHHVDFDPNSAEAKRVLRKIDWRIMPMIFTIYLLQLMARALNCQGKTEADLAGL
jgi:hypothetical protein